MHYTLDDEAMEIAISNQKTVCCGITACGQKEMDSLSLEMFKIKILYVTLSAMV